MSTTHKPDLFDKVEACIADALLVAYDGCHKIYLAMDDHEAEWFRTNFEIILQGSPEEMLAKVKDWYQDSCFLRFVNSVRYTPENPNDGFTTLIPQFAEDDMDDEVDE